MRWRGYIPALVALSVAAVPVAPCRPAAAASTRSLASRLPRAWCGRYHWRGDPLTQRFAIRFTTVSQQADGAVVARGPATITVPGRHYRLTVSATIDPRTLRIALEEHRPIPDTPDFTTDGVHRGRLDLKLRTIHAVWTQNVTGEKGDLTLHAVPAPRTALPACGNPSV
jgi:hypothetical protein